jgi:glycosyltransferase involved in cell wall biosynthesis
MHLRSLFENNNNRTAVVAFGRMNPPTIGHKKLAETISNLPGDGFIFLSHTQKGKTDPLDFDTKLRFAEQFFPKLTVGDKNVRTIIEALKAVEARGYKSVIYVAGEDRINEFAQLIHKYNGKEYNFNNIHVVSAGARDPDAPEAAGMSASKLRQAATDGDLVEFSKGVPSDNDGLTEAMYAAVRAGLGIKEDASVPDLPAMQQQPKTQQQTDDPQSEVTPVLLKKLEQYLDKLFSRVGIDVEFTRHFLDRVNDQRNVTQITIQELVVLFRATYSKYGKAIAQMGPDAQAVIKDMQTDINLPFVLNWDNKNKELDLVAKTVMRKKNFRTPDRELRV